MRFTISHLNLPPPRFSPFNSLYEIQVFKQPRTLREGEAFNSLYEIRQFQNSLARRYRLGSFNSLYEIRVRDITRQLAPGENFQFSLWDSCEVAEREPGAAGKLFQFSLWDSWKRLLSLRPKLLSFQFSLWDSNHLIGLHGFFKRWTHLSILFMRFLERTSQVDLQLYTRLSILFMRFQALK